jgi:hypothetical protein
MTEALRRTLDLDAKSLNQVIVFHAVLTVYCFYEVYAFFAPLRLCAKNVFFEELLFFVHGWQ